MRISSRLIARFWRVLAMTALISASFIAVPVLLDFDLRSFAGTKATGAKVTFSPLMAVGGPKTSSNAAGIAKATKLLKAGKAKNAAALLSKIISSGQLSPSDMATALHYRGVALRKQGKPAQAIADFTNALWLKNGLSAGLRKDALQQRAAAKREAGMAGGPRAAQQPMQTVARSRPAAATAANRGWQTQTRAVAPVRVARSPVAAAPKKPANSGIGGFFSNLFSSGNKSAKPTTATGSLPAPATAPTARQRRQQLRPNAGRLTQVSGWDSQTAVRPARRAPGPAPRAANSRRVAKAPIRQTVVARPGPGTVRAARRQNRRPVVAKAAAKAVYRLILSPVRSPEVAQANALKVKRQFASVLAQRQPVIETTTFGGGTFYQVRIGPFDDAARPRSICAKLKAGGVDCMLAKQ